ncbi:S41 family peptidase [Thalassospiraceae bacterium LMO-JJ14]|nr:S41 family peptidase [Thalassospiraceae bacterium LMO-JJ14]
MPRRMPKILLAGLLGVLLFSVITACVTNQSAIGRVVMAMNEGASQLPEVTRHELERFARVYDTYVVDASDRERLDYFNFAYRRVRANYVYEIDDAKLINEAIAGVKEQKDEPGTMPAEKVVENALHRMLKGLDPHSSYLNAEEFRDSFASTKGEFGGLGIQITMENDLVKVIAPIEDTPAERAGILAGDLITHCDGIAIKGKSLRDAVRMMRGKPGEAMTVTVRRSGVEDFDIRIVRDIIEVKSVRYRIEGDIGYIRITRFNEKTKEGINAALNDITEKMGAGLRGVVVDLRNNPGGLLNQSVIVADAFLEEGKIVAIKGRDGRDERAFYADPGDALAGVPMVVLVNQGSASASEIVASALQYHGRAIIMGRRTFGKGSVQTIMPMPLEGALRLTTALYYSPANQTLQALGVMPDINIYTDADVDNPEAATREADLPGAIPAQVNSLKRREPRIAEAKCPEIGEAKDRMLGCAIEYLHAASGQAFLKRYIPAGQS